MMPVMMVAVMIVRGLRTSANGHNYFESAIEKKKCFIVVLRCANAECQGKFSVLSPNARPPLPAVLVC